jgi:SAM-dependent methyltransferase
MSSMVSETVATLQAFLHVGCGPAKKQHTTLGFISDAWREVRLDIDPDVQPDIIGTMTDMQTVDSGSMDALFSSHNIEHLFAHEVPKALGEFRRVLKEDGFVIIACPDLQSVCQLVAQERLTEAAYQSSVGPISPLDILYGHRPALSKGNHYMAHRCGFTKKVLIGVLTAAGFPQTLVMQREAPFFDLWALASNSRRTEDELRSLVDLHFPREQRGVVIANM